MDVKRYFRGPFFWVALVIIGVLLVTSISSAAGGFKKVDTEVAINAITNGDVTKAKVVDRDQRLELTLKSDKVIGAGGATKIQTDYVDARQRQIINLLDAHQPPEGYTDSVPRTSWVVSLLINFLPILILAFLILFFFNQMQGGGSRVMQFGKSKAKLISKDTPKTTFKDVAGADEAVEELHEIKEFLENPAKFQAIGAKIPKGVLLYGRRHRQDAAGPRGGRRGRRAVLLDLRLRLRRDVRRRRRLPGPRPVRAGQVQRTAIVFVDEIDAVGRHRGAGMGGGHDEREQTLNQLLVEMDGFDVKGGVILIAADQPARHPRPRPAAPRPLRPARSRSTAPTSRAGTRSCRCTPRASRWPTTST
jgi:cell division protease FtsH